MVNENLFKAQTLEEAEIVPWPVWLHWLEDHLIHQNVGGSIPGQGTYLGCRFYPWSGVCMEGNQPILLSLSPFLSLSPSTFLVKTRVLLCHLGRCPTHVYKEEASGIQRVLCFRSYKNEKFRGRLTTSTKVLHCTYVLGRG